eukprot:4379391-Amphidinium_carterae.1
MSTEHRSYNEQTHMLQIRILAEYHTDDLHGIVTKAGFSDNEIEDTVNHHNLQQLLLRESQSLEPLEP